MLTRKHPRFVLINLLSRGLKCFLVIDRPLADAECQQKEQQERLAERGENGVSGAAFFVFFMASCESH